MEKEMDEGRKRTIGVIATIFACRKLSALEGKPSPAREMAFRDSIDLAAESAIRSCTFGREGLDCVFNAFDHVEEHAVDILPSRYRFSLPWQCLEFRDMCVRPHHRPQDDT